MLSNSSGPFVIPSALPKVMPKKRSHSTLHQDEDHSSPPRSRERREIMDCASRNLFGNEGPFLFIIKLYFYVAHHDCLT